MTPKASSFAVIGHPVAHSRSPAIHEAFARQSGILLSYTRIDAEPDAFESRVMAFFGNGGCGLNVTVPFKERAWQLAQGHLSARARDAGAVNTLWMVGHDLHGCNTDGVGLIRDLTRLGMLQGAKKILLLGAGGASRGVVGPLLQTQCEQLCVANRTADKARVLVQQWVEHHPVDQSRLMHCGLSDPQMIDSWDLVINATSSSLGSDAIALADGVITSRSCAYDMMYAAQPTPFMTAAQRNGAHSVADGLGMLVSQAAESFMIWHGVNPAVEPVIELVRKQMTGAVR